MPSKKELEYINLVNKILEFAWQKNRHGKLVWNNGELEKWAKGRIETIIKIAKNYEK